MPDQEIREQAWPIISAMLVDDDETIRLRAVEFQRIWTDGRALTKDRLLDVAEQHRELYADQIVERQTLRSELGFALANMAYEVGERVAKLILAMNAHEPIAGSVLGRWYPEFTIARAAQVDDHAADWIADAAGSIAMYRRDFVGAFLGALRHLSEETRQRALASVEERIKRDDAAAAQMAKSQNFPPPTKRAPTREYCRQAVGL